MDSSVNNNVELKINSHSKVEVTFCFSRYCLMLHLAQKSFPVRMFESNITKKNGNN